MHACYTDCMKEASTEPPTGGTIDRILAIAPSLIPSEQRVARHCAEHPDAVVEMSAADLAQATQTSPATVSRTCQNLGFRGFQHLRYLLVRDLAVQAKALAPVAAGTAGRLQAYAEGAAATIASSLSTIDPAAFDAAADAIAASRRLLIVATGGSAPAAQAAALRFVLSGRSCEAPHDAVVQQLSARVLHEGDVCLVVSESGANSVTLQAASAAADTGATIIAVTGFANSPATQLADISLIAGARYPSWDDTASSGNLVQLLTLAVLQRAVAERMSESASTGEAVFQQVTRIIAPDGSD